VNETEEDEPLNPGEILYILCQGDITRAQSVNELASEDVYRWMLIKLRCLRRSTTPGDNADGEVGE
jgi:hypothetical protein